MYTEQNFPTKKALKDAVATGVAVYCYQPGPFGRGRETGPAKVYLEGPHFPQPHKWYAVATLGEDGRILEVK